MDIKTLEQALKLQNDLAARLTQNMVSQRTGKMPNIELTLKEMEQLIARTQAEVEIAIKERDIAVSRWDERIAQRKESVAKLKEELNKLKKQLSERDTPSKEKNRVIQKRSLSPKNLDKHLGT